MIKIPSENISKLDLSGKNLVEFPLEILKLKNLKKLDLSNNRIDRIPKEISKLKRLETLDLSNNRITNFYAKLCELEKLKILNLNLNEIRTIPKQIDLLHNLRVLQLANNKISSLPKQLGNLKNLVNLNLSNNPISIFPLEIIELQGLKRIWLNKLQFKTLPISIIIENLINIDSIYCYGNIPNREIVSSNYAALTKIKGNCLPEMILLANKEKNISKEKPQSINKILPEKNKIFISYSHKDDAWLEKVQTNLEVLKYNDFEFSLWDDTRLKGGNQWKFEIDKALSESGIAILIISTDFLASKFIRNDELPTILRNAKNNGTKILPLIVRPCRFMNDKNLSEFQAVNDPSKALSELSDADAEKELVRLTDEVSNLLSI